MGAENSEVKWHLVVTLNEFTAQNMGQGVDKLTNEKIQTKPRFFQLPTSHTQYVDITCENYINSNNNASLVSSIGSTPAF